MTYTVEWGTIRTRFNATDQASPPLKTFQALTEADALEKAAYFRELGCLVLSIKDGSGKVIMDFDEIWQAVAARS